MVTSKSLNLKRGLFKVLLDINRIKHNLITVAQSFNSGDNGYTRLAFSKEEEKAIDWIAQKLRSYGAQIRKDTVGNLYGRIGPKDVPVVAFGSHLDTVENGGLFDGALGVFIGLECIRVLNDFLNDMQIAFELIVFKGEEANPLGGTFGSRTVTGQVNPDEFDDHLLKTLKLSKSNIKQALNTLPKYKAYIELHIEQGPVLESNYNKTGIVTNIAGLSRTHITVMGEPAHSGTMPMHLREDALIKVSEIVLHINQEVNKMTDGTVATVGQLDVFPNLATVVPGSVELTLEIRSGKQESIDTFEREIIEWISKNYCVDITPGVKKKANNLSKKVQETLHEAAKTLGISVMELFSGANHDANSLVDHTEVGMIFVPSIGGISHHPNENSDWNCIAKGAQLMLKALLLYNEKRNS